MTTTETSMHTFDKGRSRLTTVLGAAAVAALAPTLCLAQLGSFNPPPGPRGVYAIQNARIITVSGAPIERGTVVIGRDGKIAAVGANVTVPQGAQTIDAAGLTVYPGMMDAGTTMGLSEIGQGANATVDVAEVGSFNPNAQAYYGINPHSAHIGVTRVVGITHVVSRPSGGIVSGQAALINLAGFTPPEMAVVPKLAMVINLPRAGFAGRGFAAFLAQQQGGNAADAQRTRERQLDSLRTLLRDADAMAKRRTRTQRTSRSRAPIGMSCSPRSYLPCVVKCR
jgi:hypothetical protein